MTGRWERIDDADAADRHEPEFPVVRLGRARAVATGSTIAHYSVATVQKRGLDGQLRIVIFVNSSGPSLQSGALNAHHAAGHQQPQGLGIVLQRPMYGIARQSVPAGERGDFSILQSAETAVSGGPQCIPIEPKAVDAPSANGIVRADITVGVIGNAA